jgi:hypothetical protein
MTRRPKILGLILAATALGAIAHVSSADEVERRRVVLWDLQFEKSDKLHQVEGPWGIGDPVHETVTLHAAIRAELVPAGTRSGDAKMAQFIRGVFWNDDPCGQLFLTDGGLMSSTGLKWYWDFTDAAAASKQGNTTFEKLSCVLLGRSHFGDLQFLHGMAGDDRVRAQQTLDQMMRWAKFAYSVALGELADTTPLADVAPSYTLPNLGRTARSIFRSDNATVTRHRALGSLVHVIQDSYAPGHAERVSDANGHFGAIVRFHSYAHQDHDKHKRDDMWQGGTTDIEKIQKARGGREALEASTRVFRFFKEQRPWTDVETYLATGPFELAAPATTPRP